MRDLLQNYMTALHDEPELHDGIIGSSVTCTKATLPTHGTIYFFIFISSSIVMLHPTGQAHHSCAQTPEIAIIVLDMFFMFFFVSGPNDSLN